MGAMVGAALGLLDETNAIRTAYLRAGLTLSAMGYHGGVAGTKRSPVTVAVVVPFTLMIVLIADLDRPGEGWVKVSQEPMLELRSALAPGSRGD